MPSRMIDWSRTHRLATFTIVAGMLAAWFPYWAPGVTWIPLVCLLGGSAFLITQVVGERALTWLIGASFCIRALLTTILFAISWLKLPILQSLHRDYGLWEFGGDGVGYHDHALKILDAWHTGIDLPSVFIAGETSYDLYKGLSLPIAMVYGVLGNSPLHFTLINAWLGAMAGLLAYLLGARIGDRRSALAAAGLIAFWPSSMLWSTQLLKDVPVLATLLSAFLLMVVLWQRCSSVETAQRGRLATDLMLWGALAAAVFGLAYFRSYLATLLALSVGGVLAAALARSLWRRRWKEAVAAVGITALVSAATLSGLSVDLLQLLSPRHPEVGHVRIGDEFRQRQELHPALAAYRRAVELNPTYTPAYRGLVVTLIEQDDREAAMEMFNRYLGLESDETQREVVRDLLVAAGIVPRDSLDQAAIAAGQAAVAASAQGVTPDRPLAAVEGHGGTGAVLALWINSLRVGLSWVSAENIGELRQSQVAAGGTSVIDATADFDHLWEVFAYLPRALANAYLSPFPWQWMFTEGQSGILRPIGAAEVVLIALLLPAIISGCWQRAKRFRPEEWVIMSFIGVTAFGLGLTMANAGILFRLRLQFLFPSLILASTALPAFVDRFFDRLHRSAKRQPSAHQLPTMSDMRGAAQFREGPDDRWR